MAKAKSRSRSRSRPTAQPTRTIDLYQNKIILIAMIIIALFVVLTSLRGRGIF